MPTTQRAQEVNVRNLGAAGDNRADDSEAIQKALDSGAGRVVIPCGVYCIGRTLKVTSHTRVTVDPKAIIRLADGAGSRGDRFLMTNRNPGNGNEDIVVEGGIWDGNNANNPRGAESDPDAYTGVVLNFVNVTGLVIRQLAVRDPESFSIRVGEVRDFVVEDILFDHKRIRPNQDGIHVGGYSERGQIRRLRAELPIATNDDMVALNADDDVERVINRGMRKGPIRDIIVSDVKGNDVYTFIRMLSQSAPLERITIDQVSGSCRALGLNLNNWTYPLGHGAIRDVIFRNLELAKTATSSETKTLIDIALWVNGLVLEDLRLGPDHRNNVSTLTIRHGRPFVADLGGLAPDQVESLRRASSGVTLHPAGDHWRVEAAPGATFILPKGPIPYLKLTPA